MKGVNVKTLQTGIGAFLDKVDALLKSEPARAIGYGAAVIVYLVVNFLASKGIVRFGVSLGFEDSLIVTAAALSMVVTVIESIRKFVYSPMTYIEDVSDAVQQGHVEAHAEEEFSRVMQEAIDAQKAAQTPAKLTGKAPNKDLSN